MSIRPRQLVMQAECHGRWRQGRAPWHVIVRVRNSWYVRAASKCYYILICPRTKTKPTHSLARPSAMHWNVWGNVWWWNVRINPQGYVFDRGAMCSIEGIQKVGNTRFFYYRRAIADSWRVNLCRNYIAKACAYWNQFSKPESLGTGYNQPTQKWGTEGPSSSLDHQKTLAINSTYRKM